MTIYGLPIVINNYARLESTRNLVTQLWTRGYYNIHILDNKSEYAPLYDWYKELKIAIVHYHDNLGARAIYNSGLIKVISEYSNVVVYTDSDMSIPDSTPNNFLERFLSVYNRYYPDYKKVGCSINIEGIPENFPYRNIVIPIEKSYRDTEIEPGVYIAPVDTTFCLMSTKDAFEYKGLRLAGKDFTFFHTPWHIDIDNLTEEEIYIIKNSNPSSTHASHLKHLI